MDVGGIARDADAWNAIVLDLITVESV